MSKQFAGKLLLYLGSVSALFVLCVPNVHMTAALRKHDSQRTVVQLIDDLTQIDSQSPAINSAAIYEGFIADSVPESFQGGVLGVALSAVPPQMRELVRRGPQALPELIKHLDDARPTKLKVGNDASATSSHQVGVNVFLFSYFSDEYDPRVPQWSNEEAARNRSRPMEKSLEGRYTVKVGDVCYVLIGQIVNRDLFALRYQPSAGLVVNSPIVDPALAERVRNDWGNGDAKILEASLLADVHGRNHPKRISEVEYARRFTNPALERLRLYFPEAYRTLKGDDLRKKKEFEAQETNRHRATRSPR